MPFINGFVDRLSFKVFELFASDLIVPEEGATEKLIVAIFEILWRHDAPCVVIIEDLDIIADLRADCVGEGRNTL